MGLALYCGPAVWWLARTKSRWRYLPTHGIMGRNLIGALWLVIAGHFIVNNFSRMQVPFGFGIYWLTLGLIASLVSRRLPARDARVAGGVMRVLLHHRDVSTRDDDVRRP